MIRIAVSLLPALLFAQPLYAGAVFALETKDHDQSPAKIEQTQIMVEGRNLKMGFSEDGRPSNDSMVFRGDRREMLVFDADSNEYHVIDKQAIQQIGAQMDQAKAQMAEALKDVPPEQRAAVEQMMRQSMPSASAPKPPETTVTKTGAKATLSGYPCVKYEVRRGGRLIREVWATNWDNIEGGPQVVKAFEEMSDFLRDMMKALGTGGGDEAMDDNPFAELRQYKGFPVVAKEFSGNGSLVSESTMLSAKQKTIDPAAFEPPAGYKRRPMF